MSDIELRPCPFCGVRPECAHDYFNGRGDCVYAVACSNMECPMEVIADGNGTKEDAIRIWNTRAALTLPEGYVLVPVERGSMYVCPTCHGVGSVTQQVHDQMLAARTEVK